MPFIDFNDDSLDVKTFQRNFDVTIIGCGAVGIHLALLFAERKKSVLIIESGQVGEHPEKQALNDSLTNRADIKSSVQWGRKRALGGTTIRWGGQALPFQPLDFAARPWLGCNGWPIPYEELETHYRNAERYMGVGTNGYYAEDLKELKLKPPLQSEDLEYHVSKWAPEPNMYKRHKRELQTKATVLYNAHCTSIQKDDNGSCPFITIQNFKQGQCELPINRLIIATGGVESVRLLLANNLSHSKMLGCGFMEHPCMDLGVVTTSKPETLQSHFATRMKRGQKYGIRMSLTPQALKLYQLTHASVSLMFETPEEAFEPLRSLQNFLRKPNLKSVLNIVQHTHAFIRAGIMYARHGISWRPKAQMRLTVMCEQLASDQSRIELDANHLDPFGIPKMKLNWQIGPQTWNAACFIAKATKDALESSFPCQVTLSPELSSFDNGFDQEIFSSVNHHMGGAVMGNDPQNSVVDPQLRLHGATNIWVCSAAVFPTGSHSNPTLTALALGGRLVEEINQTSSAILS